MVMGKKDDENNYNKTQWEGEEGWGPSQLDAMPNQEKRGTQQVVVVLDNDCYWWTKMAMTTENNMGGEAKALANLMEQLTKEPEG